MTMPRFTILSIIHATIIVALCCMLARYVGRDLLSTLIVASSSTGACIGLWCYVCRPADVPGSR
jgi:uncharacterized MnhB-related membrane protein